MNALHRLNDIQTIWASDPEIKCFFAKKPARVFMPKVSKFRQLLPGDYDAGFLLHRFWKQATRKTLYKLTTYAFLNILQLDMGLFMLLLIKRIQAPVFFHPAHNGNES
jgi:hypothetical protein